MKKTNTSKIQLKINFAISETVEAVHTHTHTHTHVSDLINKKFKKIKVILRYGKIRDNCISCFAIS